MPIEFRCGHCGKLLRTGDDTAGMQAKCPACGTLQPIPSALTSASSSGGPHGEGATSPFYSGSAPSRPPPAGEVNPYQAPTSELLGPSESYYAPAPGTRTIRPSRIDVGEVIASTWAIARNNPNQFLMCFLVFLTCAVLNYVAGFVQQIILLGIQSARPPASVFIAANIVIVILGALFQLWLNLGQMLYFIRTARGEDTPFGLVFSGGRYLATIILAGLIVILIAVVVLLVCALPGVLAYWVSNDPLTGGLVFLAVWLVPSIYVGLTFSQFQYLIIDCGFGAFDSLTECRQITSGNRVSIFVLYLLGGLAVAVSFLLCCLPALLMIPFVTLGAAVMFLKMSGQITADQLLRFPPVAPPSHAGEPFR